MNFARRIAPAVALFFLAPLIAEYLIGYLPATGNFGEMIFGLLFLAPLYGGAAIIIREVARRTGRGWPTIVLLGLAFGFFQAGIIDHSLFNPSYLSIEGWPDVPNLTYIPLFGVSVYNVLTFIIGHVIWSICAPIAIIETFVPRHERSKPWLGNFGMAVTSVLYLLGSAIIFWGTAEEDQFLPSVSQFIGTAVVVAAFIAMAFIVRRQSRPPVNLSLPGPWVVGATSLVLLNMPTLIEIALELLGISSLFMMGWTGAALNLALVWVLAVLVWRWSQRKGWSTAHILALVGGALLTRAWMAFLITPISGDVAFLDKLIFNAVFFLGVVALLVAAAMKNKSYGGNVKHEA